MVRKITISLEDGLHDRALRLAGERGLSLGELVSDLIAREAAPRRIELRSWDDDVAAGRSPLYDRQTGRWTNHRAGNPFRDS